MSNFSATGIAKSVIGTGTTLRSPAPISIASKTLNQNPPQPPLKKSAVQASPIAAAGRGNPPPIPPNKPIIPVKRDQNSRIPFATSTTGGNNTATIRTNSCDYEDVAAQPLFSSNNITK